MCLIITGNSQQIRHTLLTTPKMMEDIYDYNSDGIGFMYATARNTLRVRKFLPHRYEDFVKAIKRLPQDNREIALHARYKTHGDIDLDNTHPYDVVPGRIAMMHNGVLAHGNSADRTKSDTWHYIQNHVRPMLDAYPDAFTNEGVIALIESDIGTGNRFVFMNDHGQMEIYNKHTGIEHAGMWFSNTYAWAPEVLIPGYYKAPKRSAYSGNAWGSSYGLPGFSRNTDLTKPSTTAVTTTKPSPLTTEQSIEQAQAELAEFYAGHDAHSNSSASLYDHTDPRHHMTQSEYDATFIGDIYDALYDGDADMMAELLRERPNFTLRTLLEGDSFENQTDEYEDLDPTSCAMASLLQEESIVTLSSACIEDETNIPLLACVIVWYGVWKAKAGSGELEDGEVATLDAEDIDEHDGAAVALAAARMVA